jgi:pimeloyl-ACP methyl ester carboxylesterase
MPDDVTPYRIDIDDDTLRDLRERLERTRWPEKEPVQDWSQGVPRQYVRDLCDYWAHEYDWSATQARLNAWPQIRTEIDGLGFHVVHVRSPHPHALPLVLTHGWPGSIVEFLSVIGPLTDPVAHGGDPRDAFHLVLPSLPGYGFSDKPYQPGWGIERTAWAWIELMSRLGYDRFGAGGHDWGTSITTSIAQQAPGRVLGIHLVPPLAPPDPATFDDLTEAERTALADLERAGQDDGYSLEQSRSPQTIGYGLVDSPAALCAWIVEKFHAWTDHPEAALTRDQLLDNLMFYWLPGTGASAARLYWESIRSVKDVFTGPTTDVVTVPTGCSVFPKENPRPSRRWAEKRFTDIRYWNEPEHGGHFAAFEQPDLYVAEVRAFFRLVR